MNNNQESTLLPCAKCGNDIAVEGRPFDHITKAFVCPSCQSRNCLYADEDGDGNYWFAFELDGV